MITLITDQMKEVGLEWVSDRRDGWYKQLIVNKEYLSFTGLGYEVNPWATNNNLAPMHAGNYTFNWIGRWVETKGEEGMAPGPDPSYLPLAPAENWAADPSGSIMELYNLWQDARAHERLSPGRIEKGSSLFRIGAMESYVIGTLGFVGNFRGVYLNRNNVRNQPITHFVDHYGYYSWTFYLEDGIDNFHEGNRSKLYSSKSYVGMAVQ